MSEVRLPVTIVKNEIVSVPHDVILNAAIELIRQAHGLSGRYLATNPKTGKIWISEDEPSPHHGSVGTEHIRAATPSDLAAFETINRLYTLSRWMSSKNASSQLPEYES